MPEGGITAPDYCDPIVQPRQPRVLIVGLATAACAMTLALWRMRSGLAMIGDSGSYLAGASGLAQGRFFDTPLVPSFSELALIDTVRNSGWSPYADFGIGLPVVIAMFDLFLPLTTAAAAVNVLAIGLIALGIVIGPWNPRHSSEMWLRSASAIAICGWPILRFTAIGVLSEPIFCAALIWLVIIVARMTSPRVGWLIGSGALTAFIGAIRFVGPIVAIVVAVFLVQRGLRSRHAILWGVVTSVGPLAVTAIAAGGSGTRTLGVHSFESSDVFFTARGIGGWFEAGMGDQTATLLRTSFLPDIVDWMITLIGFIAAVVIVWSWIDRIRRRTSSPFEPALVIAVMLVLAVIPSMIFIDAVVKLENRILMPSGLLVLSTAVWWLGRNARPSIAWCAVVVWAVVATHPWNWLDRPEPPAATDLTDAVFDVDTAYVLTDQADLVWWVTRVPARYLPDGYHDLSDRTYDAVATMRDLPCELARTDGAIVFVTANVDPALVELLASNTRAGDYERGDHANGISSYSPTGRGC